MTSIILALIVVASFSFGFCVACWLAMASRSDHSDTRAVYSRSDN